MPDRWRARRRDREGAANRKAIPLRLFALPGQRIVAISEGVDVIRFELEHPLEIFDGSVVGATAHVSEATIVERVDIVRVKLNGSVEIVHGAIDWPIW